MRTLAPSLDAAGELDPVGRVVLEFEEAWRSGPPLLDRFRARFGGADVSYGVAELVLADLRNRFARGERPAVREYLGRYPELAAEQGRALSLIYEEYCLRAEAGEAVNPSVFCRGYPTWRDSLVSQLAYHRDLSRAVEPVDSTPAFPRPGDRFGEFELVELLGKGASAHVFHARMAKLGGKSFALKISPDRGDEPRIIGRLDHPNIVPVSSIVVDPGTGLRGLCMPYRPGVTLDEVVRGLRGRGGPPRRARDLRAMVDPEADTRRTHGDAPGWSDFPGAGSYADAVAWVGLKIAQALSHAHGRGFYHRDVKPENVLLNGRDGPQLIDFNLAHDPALAGAARSAHRGGTLPYMAREHLEAFLDPARWDEVDGRADLFSLGLVLRELLTLQPPPRPGDRLPLPRAINAMIQAREAARPPIRDANPRVPHALAAIVAKCLTASAADRYASAADLAADLALYLGRRPLLYAKNPSPLEVALNGLRRHRAPFAAAAVAVAIAIPCLRIYYDSHGALDIRASSETLEALEAAVGAESLGRAADANTKITEIVGERGDAIAGMKATLRRHPGSLALRLGLAKAYEAALWPDQAEREYRDVLARDPHCVAAIGGLGNVEQMRGRHAEAIRLFDQAIDGASGAEDLASCGAVPSYRRNRGFELILLGEEDRERGRFEAACVRFEKALSDFASIDPHTNGKLDKTLLLRRKHFSALAGLGLGRSLLA
ncbi:MAG TPA: serine/threonine-protein kinase, partial [Isosphaeraceae bacterium]